MLSIGKLAYLAQAQETNSAVEDRVLDGMSLVPSVVAWMLKLVIPAFHDGLDFVSVHDSLLEDLRSALSGSRSRQPIDQQVDIIARAKATRLIATGRRSLLGVFKQLVKRLLQGKALNVEDAADALSLKDNEGEGQQENFVIALRLLVHAKVRFTEAFPVVLTQKNVTQVPEARKQNAFKSVWRRIYLHDECVPCSSSKF